METSEKIKRGLECDSCADCPWSGEDGCLWSEDFALAYIRQLEQDNAQKDERIMWLEMMNAEYKHVLGYIKHAADMGVHGDADALAMFGINTGQGAEEENHENAQ